MAFDTNARLHARRDITVGMVLSVCASNGSFLMGAKGSNGLLHRCIIRMLCHFSPSGGGKILFLGCYEILVKKADHRWHGSDKACNLDISSCCTCGIEIIFSWNLFTCRLRSLDARNAFSQKVPEILVNTSDVALEAWLWFEWFLTDAAFEISLILMNMLQVGFLDRH